ncbi:hypothetical protein LCGC14_0818530 [marine sediment metagenome]|uniref:ArnR1-like winged helix-turn-helix domain-containing protein n=1 Tax=marine sediment metagenome TaxID=412755 RepID=A0A0F9SS07_9ZZZZ
MKTFEQLTRREKSVLLIWGNYLDFSTSAHYPIEKVKKKLRNSLSEIRDIDIKRMIKTLINSGFFVRHPTGRNETYGLTIRGLKCCNILKRENSI